MLLLPQTTSKPVIEQFWILDPECPGSFRKSLPQEPTASERMPSPFLSPIPVPAVSYRKPSQVASSKLGWAPLLYPLPTSATRIALNSSYQLMCVASIRHVTALGICFQHETCCGLVHDHFMLEVCLGFAHCYDSDGSDTEA